MCSSVVIIVTVSLPQRDCNGGICPLSMEERFCPPATGWPP